MRDSMGIPFTPPEFEKKAFNCPECLAYAEFIWYEVWITGGDRGGNQQYAPLRCARCSHCDRVTVWHLGSMVVPDASLAPPPNPDLPDDIAADYDEAASILSKSPRGAAALLRLCVQKLCAFLGESGRDTNADIASLVRKGLSDKIQKSLDIVRVVGNESVHPGQLDLKDDISVASQLFVIVNLIADVMITQPKSIDALYERLPESKKEQIAKRDAGRG
jgi:hypothetical protein